METLASTLVIVHPGSACGSANYNIGRFEARAARDAIASLCDHWDTGVIVLDGETSEDLAEFPMFAGAIERAVERARGAGHLAIRQYAHDPDQVEAIQEIARSHPHLLASPVLVTGAWYHPENDGFGCVNSVIDAINAMGGQAVVAEAVVAIED